MRPDAHATTSTRSGCKAQSNAPNVAATVVEMTPDRWQDFYEVMRDAGVYPADLDYKSAFDTTFVDKGVGLDQKASLKAK